jgi:hypothetical protein
MTLIAKNNSGSTQRYLSLVHENGVNVQISDFYSQFDISTSSALNSLITAGDIVLNDGSNDLSVSEALNATEIGVFNYENAVGITQVTGQIITPPILYNDQNNYEPSGFDTCNLIRQEINGDRAITGFQAPPAGINRIIRIQNIDTSSNIKFKNNSSSSTSANRILIRDNGPDKSIKENEIAAFWYDHDDNRWRAYSRVG